MLRLKVHEIIVNQVLSSAVSLERMEAKDNLYAI